MEILNYCTAKQTNKKQNNNRMYKNRNKKYITTELSGVITANTEVMIF